MIWDIEYVRRRIENEATENVNRPMCRRRANKYFVSVRKKIILIWQVLVSARWEKFCIFPIFAVNSLEK